MDDYSNFYATLGVDPDTDWETLRGHYKRLIGQWHPDRFVGDTAAREIAEERSKQITLAYQALGNYRRKHGVLPPQKPTIRVGAQGPRHHPDPASDRVDSNDREATSAMDTTVSERSRTTPPHRVALAIFIIVPALYLADRCAGPTAPSDSQSSYAISRPDTPTQAPAESPREPAWIWIGSTVGDVYAAQGVPTFTQRDTWHYGKSQIHFVRGRVISWNQDPSSPLRIGRDQPAQMQDGTFEVGSTKDKVWTIQGTPVTETDTVWDYGLSRVHFRDNRVIHWEESPMQPLRVAH